MAKELAPQNPEVRKIKRQFHKINNTLAEISQKEVDLAERKKELSAKKKELTKSIDKELKEIKDELKRMSDKRIFTLGERNARLTDLKQLGLTTEIEAQKKKVTTNIHKLTMSN